VALAQSTNTPQVGSLVQARGRDWVVLPPPSPDVMQLRPLERVMNFPESLEGVMPMNHKPILPMTESCRSHAMSLAPCAVPRPLTAPKIASGALDPAATSTQVHNRL
jgi:hypothetical protein